MSSNSISPATISLLRNRELRVRSQKLSMVYARWTAHLDALSFRQADPWLLSANHKNIRLASSKGIIDGIFDMHNIEASIMTFAMSDHTYSAHVASTCYHGDDCRIEADKVGDLASGEIDFDSIVNFDSRVRVSNPGNMEPPGQQFPGNTSKA